MCVCPQGYAGVDCSNDLYTRCYINITDPALYQGCEDKFTDSFYYLYSVPGFSPCFWFDFSTSITVSYTLNCQQVTTNGLVDMEKGPRVGYQYRDVIKEASVSPSTLVSSSSAETEYAVNGVAATVQFDFRDMKYLSQKKSFK